MLLSEYSGYGKSKLALHWTPVAYHAHSDLTWALDKCQQMGLGWVVLIDDGGGSTLQPSNFYGGRTIIDMFQERNIIPIIRFFAPANAKVNSRMEEAASRLVEHGVRYIFWSNEPEVGSTEWKDRPKNWVEVVTRNYVDGAYKLLKLGVYPGAWATTTFHFPDADGNIVNPYDIYMSQTERDDIFKNGPGWIAIHPYCKNHPVAYPYDNVNQFGTSMTHEEYLAKLDEVDKTYRKTQHLWVFDDYQVSEHHINFVRENGKNPGATIYTDDTCFWMYKGINKYLSDLGLLDYVPILATEAGPSVGERDDGRYARVTPQEQIRMVDAQIGDIKNVSNFFCIGFWLAGVQRLDAATADGFEDQSWFTDRNNEPFNLQGELPIVQYLINKQQVKETCMNKLGVHVQIGSQDLLPIISEIKAPINKTMDLNREWVKSMKEASPNSLLVGRAYVDNQDKYKTDPQGLINEMLNKYAPAINYLDVIEVPNEVMNNNVSQSEKSAWDAFQVFFCQAAWSRWPNIKVALFNIPTGNGGIDGELTLNEFPMSMNLPIDKVFIAIHEYGWPLISDGQGWYALRYRKIMSKYPNHRVIITECGVTNAIIEGQPDVGWRTHGDRKGYIDSLVWYNSELNKDNYVIGATIFMSGPSFSWDSFESVQELREAVQMIPFFDLPPEPPAIIEPIRVKVDDEILIIELEEYVAGVVPCEVVPSWPMECLKAAAVQARSYGKWRVQHPRDETFDVFADARDQVYDESRRHERTDLAVEETEGIWLIKND